MEIVVHSKNSVLIEVSKESVPFQVEIVIRHQVGPLT